MRSLTWFQVRLSRWITVAPGGNAIVTELPASPQGFIHSVIWTKWSKIETLGVDSGNLILGCGDTSCHGCSQLRGFSA